MFADLLLRDVPGPGPALRLTTGVFNSFELILRADGRSPTSSFLLCSLFSYALGLPQAACVEIPCSREREEAVGRYRTLFAAFEIPPQDILLRLINRRLDIGPHVQEYLAGLDAEWEGALDTMDPRGSKRAGGRYHAPSRSGGGGAFTQRNGSDAGERPDDEGKAGARMRSSRRDRDLPERGK